MNILQISSLDNKGGAAKVAYSLKKELEKRGNTTSMFVSRKYSDDKDIYLLNDVRSFTGKVCKKLAYWFANDIDLFSSDKILKTREFKEADIIHCHNLHGNYFNLSTLQKISRTKPIIWTFHDMWPVTAHCAHSFGGKIKDSGFFTCPSLNIPPIIAWHNEKYLETRKSIIYKNSNFHIVTPSKWLADKIGKSILKDKPLSVIYNGIDTSVFRPYNNQESRHSLGLPLDKRIILIVAKGGVSNPWKGGNYAQDTMKAFMADSRTFFVNLGSGDTSHGSSLFKTVSYVSDQTTLAKYYSAADLLLYPSVADNCPLVALEAQACGLPLVTFKTGGIPEIIGHKETGYIADYKDTNGLIDGINFMLNLKPKESENFRKNSVKKVAEKFTLTHMTDSYLKLYEDLVYQFHR